MPKIKEKRGRGRPPKPKVETTPEQDNLKAILESFRMSIRPDDYFDIVEWCSKNVYLARSKPSRYADLESTPYAIKPLETIIGNSESEICLLAPVGSGKTAMLECLIALIISKKPGPTLMALQGREEAQQLFETGVFPMIEANPEIRKLLPKNKNHIRKNFIKFPTMPLWLGGSNKNMFQSKSCDYVILDEVWLVDKGLINEARRRTHNRFNSKFVMTSQASLFGTDFHKETKAFRVEEWCHHCDCGCVAPIDFFKNIKWEIDKFQESDNYNFDSLKVWYECEQCGKIYKDDPVDRRKLMEGCSYVSQPITVNNPEPKKVLFHYNAFTVFWIPWSKLVIDYLKAKELTRLGDYTRIASFYNQVLAQFFDPTFSDDTKINYSGYLMHEASPWEYTAIGSDVQKDRIYWVCRSFSKNGDSRLLDYGLVPHFSDLDRVAKQYNVKPINVFIDNAYDTSVVNEQCVMYGWTPVSGRDPDWFDVTTKYGKKMKRIYSEPIPYDKGLQGFYFSTQQFADIVNVLKTGNGPFWGIPDDVDSHGCKSYTEQISAEHKVFVKGKLKWTPKYSTIANHLLDCERHVLLGAIISGYFTNITTTEEETK